MDAIHVRELGFIRDHETAVTVAAGVVTALSAAAVSTGATLAAQAITYTVPSAQIIAYRAATAVATAAQWRLNADCSRTR